MQEGAFRPDTQQTKLSINETRPDSSEAAATALTALQVPAPPPIDEPAAPTVGSIEPPEERVAAIEKESALPAPDAVRLKTPPLIPHRSAGRFPAADWELLSYRISMFGIPVGTAEMEAKREEGGGRITLRIRSNPAISGIYPVDDWVETRQIGDSFILSRIRQQEGSYRGDRGFTLMLQDQCVFWIDRLKNTSFREPLPNGKVVDILTGLYYLRTRPLEVGKSVQLHLFDSDRYALTEVDVQGKERLSLPGPRELDTLRIRPQLQSEGIFRSTGDILIWLSDDPDKVPVKVETRIPLGKVTAELVSARSHPQGVSPPGTSQIKPAEDGKGPLAPRP